MSSKKFSGNILLDNSMTHILKKKAKNVVVGRKQLFQILHFQVARVLARSNFCHTIFANFEN